MTKIDKIDIDNIKVILNESKIDNVSKFRIKKGDYEIEISSEQLVNSIDTKEIKSQKKNKKELSTLVAEILAKKAKDKKITKVYFDRGVYKYHGRVKLLAEELRKNGMEF